MKYARKDTQGVWTSSEYPYEGAFPVQTVRDVLIYDILVWQGVDNIWVEDAELLAVYEIKKAKDDLVNLRIAKQNFGSKFLATVVELNVSKFVAGSLTQSDLTAMDTDASLQAMERAAWRGNLTTLKALMQAYSGSYYTAPEKAALVALIDNSGLV